MHWHLDVTFREDANMTIEKRAAENMSIIRKMALNILKMLDIWKKRFTISCRFEEYVEQLLGL